MSIEEIILYNSSRRRMSVLAQSLPAGFLSDTAEAFLSVERGNVFLATGFYVNGHPETDGPPGVWAIAQAIKKLGFNPIIITDRLCGGIFEPECIQVEYIDQLATDEDMKSLLKKYSPVAMISAERCGRNRDGKYLNMSGFDISSHTAPVDSLFLLCGDEILTIGIGDGGNEIGMGNVRDLAKDILEISPCSIQVNRLLIATVSNWACYAFCAAMEKNTGISLLPGFSELSSFMERIIAMGCVDGMSGQPELKEDGYGIEMTERIISQLRECCRY